jgi:hypothetical protein
MRIVPEYFDYYILPPITGLLASPYVIQAANQLNNDYIYGIIPLITIAQYVSAVVRKNFEQKNILRNYQNIAFVASHLIGSSIAFSPILMVPVFGMYNLSLKVVAYGCFIIFGTVITSSTVYLSMPVILISSFVIAAGRHFLSNNPPPRANN